MAEDNIGFDPLESLGNDYGKINGAGLDTKSFQPFEGDRIETPEINFGASQKFYPVYPAIENLDRPNRQIKATVANSLTNTPNKKNAIANTNPKDILKAFGQMVIAKSEAYQSVDDVAKMYAYDASPSGNAFYKRYAAYGQEKFDAIGFHPLRDNEANFNARTTKWDDWSRMMTHSFWPLFGQGFTSAPKSMAKLMQFDFSSDVGEASEYEEAAAIGQSTKGGAFGFINNTAMNFGYTAGIITEAIAEELVGLALAAPTGGASLFAATANNARKLFTIGKGIDKAVDGLNAVNDTIGAINNVSKARSFWTATKAAAASKVGKIINPLDNTFDAYSAAKKVDNITNLAVLSKTAGGFYRDVRNINMALAEGRLEAGMVQNHVYDELYNEAYEKTGLAPSDQEQQYMRQQSKEASANTLFWNTGLIYLSNKVTFDNITGPRGGLRNFMKSTVDDVVSIGDGKFGTLGKVVYDKTKKAFEFEKNNVVNLAKSWWKNPGYKTAAKTIGYMKGNFSEGIQENLQEVIAGVNERYYIDTFNSKGRRSLEYAKGALNINKGDYFNEELGKQFSAQGFETFASGFVMGMPAGVLNNAMPFLSTSYNRIFNKDEYTKYKDNKLKITKDIVKSLNDININDFLNSRAFNYGAQDVIAEIKQSASKKEALDSELEGLTKAMSVMVNSNTTDIFIDKLKAYNDMNDNEFMDAMKLTDKEEIPKYRERINMSVGKIEKLKKRHDFYSEKFINPVKLENLEGLDKTSDEYKNAVSLHHGWNLAIENAVFLNESFEDNMKRMSEIQTKFLNNISLNNTGQREMGIIFQPAKLGSEIELLTNEIKSLTDINDKSESGVKKLKLKKLALKTLTEFKAKHDQFELFYNRSDYYEQAKQKLKKDLGRLPTDEEITDAIDKQLGKIDDVEKQVKYVSELKLAFNEYLQHIATTGDDVVFDSNLDASFTLLLDHYKLGLEGKNMVKYINTLHDPNNFSDLARRNQEWMKSLYESKAEYYENMIVKPELKNVEDNALLNRLASRNIYVSEADLIKWREEGIIPTEFFDNTNKKVIPKDSPEYEREVALFKYASALQDESEDISNEIYGEELQIKINNLNAKETEEIDALPKVETKTDSRTIRKNYRKSFSINDINNDVKDGEFVDLEYKDGKEIKTITLFKDNGDLKLDNAEGAIINLDEYKFKYKSGLIYKIKLVADEVEVELIKSNYNGLRKKAVKESKVKPVAFKPITKDTPINEYDENLQQKLFIQHEEFVKANPEIYKDILDDEEAFDKAFTNYIHTDPEAIKLVDEYNGANTGTVKEPVVEGEGIEEPIDAELDALEEQGGMNVGKGLSPKAETKFAKLGFTQEMIDVMSNEEIEEAKTFNAVDDAEVMRIMLTNRLKSLGIEVPEITEVILSKKDKLVAKKDIFIKDETGTNVIFVEANGTATITKINEKDNTVNLKVGNKKGVHTFKIDELDSLFNLNQVVMNDELVVETPEFIPTTEEKIILEESNGNVENFMDDSAKQKEIEAKADKLTDQELDDDILNDLDCK